MRAAEKKSIDLGVGYWREKPLGENANLVAMQLPPFDEFDKTRAGSAGEPDTIVDLGNCGLIRTAANGADGSDDTHVIGGAHLQQRPDTGVDHADDRRVVGGLQVGERRRRRGVARHDNELHVVGVDEPLGDLVAVRPDVFLRFTAVGVSAGIANVDQLFLRKEVDQRACNGEPTETAIEYPDRTIVHLLTIRRVTEATWHLFAKRYQVPFSQKEPGTSIVEWFWGG